MNGRQFIIDNCYKLLDTPLILTLIIKPILGINP